MDYADAFQAWQAGTLKKTLDRFPERKPAFRTLSGLPVERLYGPTDAGPESARALKGLGFPGAFPFTRGVQPTGYRGRLWTMRQYAGFSSAQASNERYRYLLEQGTTGLSVAFDLPTQIGYDSSDAIAAGEVGKVGVPISCLADMEVLFDAIPLDKISVSMTINSSAAVLLAFYVALAKRRGTDLTKLRGTLQNDILKEYIARGTFRFPPRPSMRLIVDTFEYCSQHLPRWNPISISGYHIREAGSTAVQELAFTFANAQEYVRAAVARGLPIDAFAGRLSFFFNAHNDFFEEVAKFRAARRMWARIMRDGFGAEDPRSWRMRFHTQTAGSTLTQQQPDVNVVRVTLQALASVLGGTQSLHTNSRDEALSLPTAEAARLALRTQQVIAYESGVADTVDPLAGSYYLESLTDRLELEALKLLGKIEDLGGALAGIEQGFQQQAIHAEAYATQRALETGELVQVGVNRFVEDEDLSNFELFRPDPDVEATRRGFLADLRASRDAEAVSACRARLLEAAQGSENLVPLLIEAVECGTTLGEICTTLSEVFGEYAEAENY